MKIVYIGTELDSVTALIEAVLRSEYNHKLRIIAKEPQLVPIPENLEPEDRRRISVVAADLDDAVGLNDIMARQQAAIIDLPIRIGRPIHEYPKILKHLMFMAKKHRVRRLIMPGPVLSEASRFRFGRLRRLNLYYKRLFDRKPWRLLNELESIVRTDPYVKWTIVRHPQIIEAGKEGRVYFGNKHLPGPLSYITRGDLTHWMLQALDEELFVRDEAFCFYRQTYFRF